MNLINEVLEEKGNLPLSAILGYIVINDNAKNKLLEMGTPDSQIHISSTSYF